MKPDATGKQLFIDQMTRKLLVDWCHDAVLDGSCPPQGVVVPSTVHPDDWNKTEPNPYLKHAISKGWVSKDGRNILSAGWQTAARFLKR